jgi:hypothetical protein
MLPGFHKGLPRVFNKAVEQAPDLLVIGDPDSPEHYSGPVVSASQFEKVMGYTEVGKGEGELAIISVGADNNLGHPSADTLNRLRAIPTYRTDQDGSIEMVTDGSVYSIQPQP